MKKVGNTSFNVEAVKKMSLKQFQEVYKDILKGQDLKAIYQEVTGKSGSEAPKPEE